jgi:signal transduction histidine kinase/ActR/RegA family two-component response regulator
MTARGRTLGALTFVAAESGRHYNDDDVNFALDVASRAAFAVENARAYEQLRAADRLKDEFLATLSHELRTPLNAILGYARMARSGMLTGERLARAVETVERNATLLTHIVEDVLDVSRIVSGKLRLNVQPTDLSLVLHDALATMLPAAEAKGVRLHTVIDPQVGPVSGDPDRLQQVVWNLLANAVKFTKRGGQVQVRLQRVNSHVEIVVSDTGVGIRPEFLPHIFERFSQGDSGPTREHSGLGLGLAIARHIVEMHGGTIHAASAGEGQGSTFSIRLPLMIVHAAPRPEAAREHPRTERPIAAGDLPDLTGVRVLAVDDDQDALSLLREILEATGARVATTTSGSFALENIEADCPDVLISDLGLPGMDGFQLIERIRSLGGRCADMAAAALTAYARTEDRAKSLRAGFEMHLTKPIDPSELVAAVAALTRRRMITKK